MRRLFIEQDGLLGTASIASDSPVLIAAALTSLVVALAAAWWFRSRSQPPAPGGAGGRADRWRLLGNGLMVAGVLLAAVAGYIYVSDMTDPSRSLPRPVALQSTGGEVSSVSAAPLSTATSTVEPTPTATASPSTPTPAAAAVTAEPAPEETPEPTSTPVPPTATPEPEPTEVVEPPPSASGEFPDRMVIPSIGVDSRVLETGTYWLGGELHWQTQPWAISYYSVTGAVGHNGNAAFSGHVSTRQYGNVFKELFKVELGDTIDVFAGGEKFTYVVDSIRLVSPTETSVMDPTPDPVITLITCAGDWIESERNYTERLIVRATMQR